MRSTAPSSSTRKSLPRLSLQRRHRADAAHPGAGCVTRPRRYAAAATARHAACALSRSLARCRRWRRPHRASHTESDSRRDSARDATASPIPRAAAAAAASTEFGGGRKRAAAAGRRALHGGGNPNRTEGSNPSSPLLTLPPTLALLLKAPDRWSEACARWGPRPQDVCR